MKVELENWQCDFSFQVQLSSLNNRRVKIPFLLKVLEKTFFSASEHRNTLRYSSLVSEAELHWTALLTNDLPLAADASNRAFLQLSYQPLTQ